MTETVTNQAAWQKAPGQPLRIGVTALPHLAANEILIRNAAIAINPLDWILQDVALLPWLDYPAILGSDVSGEVAAVGGAVERFKVGDRVIAAFVVRGGPGFEEADFTDEQRVRVAEDGFAHPLEHVQFLVEAVGTGGPQVALLAFHGNAHRPARFRVRGIRIQPQRAHPAFLRANRALLAGLEGAELWCPLFLRFQGFGCELLPLFARELGQVVPVPLPDSESWREVFWFSCHNPANYHIGHFRPSHEFKRNKPR